MHKSLNSLCLLHCFSGSLTASMQGNSVDEKSNTGHTGFALKAYKRRTKEENRDPDRTEWKGRIKNNPRGKGRKKKTKFSGRVGWDLIYTLIEISWIS